MSLLGALAVSIIGDNRDLNKVFDDTTKKIQGFGKGMQTLGGNMVKLGTGMTAGITVPIMAAVGGLIAVTTQAGNYADALLDLSAVTGVSTDQLQRWRYMSVAAGTDSEAVADALSRMNRQMVESSEFGERLERTAQNYGVALRDASGAARDGTDVITDLMMAIASIEDPAERARAGAQAFGRDWTAVAPIVDLGTEAIKRWNEQEVISREKLERANEFREKWDLMKHSISLAFLEMGFNLIPTMEGFVELISTKVVPWIGRFVEKIGELTAWFADLDPWVQNLIGGFVGIAAAAGPVLVIVGTVIKAIGAILAVLTAKVLLIGVVIAAIIAIGVAIYNWVNENEEVKAKIMAAWEAIKEALSGAWTALQELAAVVTEKIQEFWAKHGETIMAAVEVAWSFIVTAVETAVGLIQTIIQTVTAIISGDWAAAWEGIKAIFESIATIMANVGAAIFTMFATALGIIWEGIKNKVIEVWTNIKQAVVTKATEVYNDTKAKLDGLWEYIKGIPGNALQWGRDIMQALWDGIKAKWDSFKQGIKDIATDIKNAFNPWARQSPSLIDNIKSGVAEIEKLYSNISLPTNGLQVAAAPLSAIGASGGGMQHITINANYNVASKQAAEHANDDLIRKLQLRGRGRL